MNRKALADRARKLAEQGRRTSDTLDHITDKAKPLVERIFASRFTWAWVSAGLLGWLDIAWRIVRWLL